MDRERVDHVGELMVERGIHLAVPAQTRFAPKALADNVHAKMTAAIGSADVSSVKRALVFDDQVFRFERLPEGRADALDAIARSTHVGYAFSSRRTYLRMPPCW